MLRWAKLGDGNYNTAYVSHDETLVLKISKDYDQKTDGPLRSARIWNELNPHITPKAEVVVIKDPITKKLVVGWTCPYIKGEQASDNEICDAVIDIFNRTGRIVTDAAAPRNFIKTAQQDIVCIDVGFALQLHKKRIPSLQRQKSRVSLRTWKVMNSEFMPYFKDTAYFFPKSVSVIKALLFIQKNRPNILNADFLKCDAELTLDLAREYNYQMAGMKCAYDTVLENLDIAHKKMLSSPSLKEGLFNKSEQESKKEDAPSQDEIESKEKKEVLHEAKIEKQLTFLPIQKSCLTELHHYINSRGSYNEKTGEFKTSIKTKFFRNTALTITKVTKIIELKNSIEKTTSLEQLRELLEEVSVRYFKSNYKSHLEVCIGMCEDIVKLGVQLEQDEQPSKPKKHLQAQHKLAS
jgi:hypothetical protein